MFPTFLTTLVLTMMVRHSSPYVHFYPRYLWGPTASRHPHAIASRCSAAATVLGEGSYNADADNPGSKSPPRHAGAADIPAPCLQDSYAAECTGQERRADRLSCLRAEKYDEDRYCSRELEPVSINASSSYLLAFFPSLQVM